MLVIWAGVSCLCSPPPPAPARWHVVSLGSGAVLTFPPNPAYLLLSWEVVTMLLWSVQQLMPAVCQILALDVVGSEADSPHPRGGSPLVGETDLHFQVILGRARVWPGELSFRGTWRPQGGMSKEGSQGGLGAGAGGPGGKGGRHQGF